MTAPPGTAATTFGAICSSGSTAEQTPACAAAPACPRPRWSLRPARSRCRRPRRCRRRRACRRSPCRSGSAPGFQAPQTSAAEANSGSTAGLQKLHRRAVVERDRRRCRRGARPSCAGRRARDRSCRRSTGSPSTASCAGLAAGARQMLGQDGGEGRRHVLRDQDRRAVDDRRRAARPGWSAPAARRSRRRSAARAAASARTGAA